MDLSVYLVTGRSLLPPGKNYYESLEESLQGGVTIVQIREKDADTIEFLEIARKSKAICDKYGVPMLINDRVDIALAVNAAGVHVGQKDMPLLLARKLLPDGSIIGVSCNNIEHVKRSLLEGADYIGISPIWPTSTKTDADPAVGVRGVPPLLELLEGQTMKAVAIGGIKCKNLLRLLYSSASPKGRALDGVAVVSEIVASMEPRQAASNIAQTIRSFQALPPPTASFSPFALDNVSQLLQRIRIVNPLVHQITNTVVQTQSANISLAIGASPIMADAPEEMEDLAKISGALLVNIGTIQAEQLKGMLKAGYYANFYKKPIVLDPVGVGASQFRMESIQALLNEWQPTVIKGNAAELSALAGSLEVASKGVDSEGPGFEDPVTFVRSLAQREKCVIVLTGPTDYVACPLRKTVIAISNGDPLLGKITGSGCMLGSCIAAFCAVSSALANEPEHSTGLATGDMFLGAVAGVLCLTVAADLAMQHHSPLGPGSFLNSLLDELALPTSYEEMIKLAKIQVYE